MSRLKRYPVRCLGSGHLVVSVILVGWACVGCKVARCPTAIADLPRPINGVSEALVAREVARREGAEAYSRRLLSQADDMLKARRYTAAIGLFEEVLTHAGQRPEAREVCVRAERGLAEAHYQWALFAWRTGDRTRSLVRAAFAESMGHAGARRLAARIRREQGE
jgi:hypothetical protein